MATEFQAFSLHPALMQAVDELGYESPTPIQERAIPALMNGRDVLGQAQTGTGKTAAFALPMLHALQTDEPRARVQGLVVAPTRELAVRKMVRALNEYKLLGVKTSKRFMIDVLQHPEFEAGRTIAAAGVEIRIGVFAGNAGDADVAGTDQGAAFLAAAEALGMEKSFELHGAHGIPARPVDGVNCLACTGDALEIRTSDRGQRSR